MSEKKTMSAEAKRNLIVIASVFGVALVLGVGFIMSAMNSNKTAGIAKSSIPEISTDPVDKPAGSTSVNSEEITRLNKLMDEEKARDAAKTGATYIPNVIEGEKQVVDPNARDPLITPLVQPIAVSSVPVIAAPAPAEPPPPVSKLAMLATLTGDIKPVESVSGKTTGGLISAVATAGTIPALATPPAAPVKPCPIDAVCNGAGKMMLASAGSKAFVQIEVAIMTDEPSPVFGKLIAGGNPILRNRSILGTYVQNADLTVSIVFNKLSLKNGMVPISATVIDSNTGRTAIAGSIDHKFFTRFGLPMIAGAGTEFAMLTQQAGSTMATGVGTMVQTSTLSGAQVGQAALGAGLGNAATALNAAAVGAKPSTELPNNLGVEIRFLEDLWIPIP